jgi:predicted O-linked N-acetylglucosamine transferase (SPINDLY family)
MVLCKLNHPAEALASFDRAIEINERYAEAHCNRGTLLRDLGRLDEALKSYDRSIAIQPGLSLAYFNRGALLQHEGFFAEALTNYEKAIEIDPGSAAAHCNRGVLLGELERPEEGLASIDRAIALEPDSVSAHFNRAEALMKMKRLEAALISYDLALGLRRSHPFLLGSRRFAKAILCDWRGIDADIDEIAAATRHGQRVATPFQVVALLDDPALQHQSARIWSDLNFPAVPSAPEVDDSDQHRKIHLAYFSADFREHPVGILMAELFETHDRSHFEVTAFSLGAETQDPLRKRLEGSFDRFIDVRGKSDKQISALARELRVDIAVDLGGHTAESRTRIFADRAAPIQVNYLGYAGTMGADYFDYLVADQISVPRTLADHFSERIVHLPHTFLPNDSRREIAAVAYTREQCRLPLDGFVFCCFNNSYKLNPPVFDSWMHILHRVDNSVLWLSSHHPRTAANLRREASQLGIDPARLIFADRAALQADYLARLRVGDLFLDTLPYNAHTTAIDALWAGLPVLTRTGRGFAGRVGASLLSAIDLGELVTSTVEEYRDLAVALATNPPRLAAIRRRLAENRLRAPLFDTVSFTRHLEAAYRQMHQRRLAGLSPAAFRVEPVPSVQ